MPDLGALPWFVVAALLSLATLYLRRAAKTLELLYDCVVGTIAKPGLVPRMQAVEEQLAEISAWPEHERRRRDRDRRGLPRDD